MKTFYKMLFTTLKNQDQYLETLALITQASRGRIDSMASDLAWQSWDAQTTSPSNA
jgi:hypothetical protein